ncbi:PQQ-binding-like beta-propeller repeat protein [bacterium]|nr:PQQ-binding-like beta-propeller repeat protein [bacterium]
MVKSATLRLAVITAALLCAFALAFASCGKGKHSTGNVALPSPTGDLSPTASPSQSPDDALAELDALACPEGVDAALWTELKDAFADTLAARGEAKTVSTPPTGEANRVNDLAITDNGDGTYTLSWHYRNLGDYDQNGIVGISDITPLAQHFGETVPEDDLSRTSIQAVIDGSGNGVVDIADITAIAANYLSEFSEYVVERSFAAPAQYAKVGALTLADATSDGAKRFSHIIPFARRMLFRVAPCHPSGKAGVYSEPVELRIAGGDWHMHCKDPQHTMRSPYVGPQMVGAITATKARGHFKWNSVISDEGIIYVMLKGHNGGLWAINRDGTVSWIFTLSDHEIPEFSSPAIAKDGMLYFSSVSHLLAVNPDGSLKWRVELPAAGYFSSPTVGPDGAIYLGTGDGFRDTEDGYLIALNPDGSLRWDYLAGSGVVSTAAVREDGTVYSATYEGTVFALNGDGSLKWELEVGRAGALWSSPAIGDDGTIYIGVQGGKWNAPPEGDIGYLDAISADGSLKWEFQTEGWISSCPAIAEDGTVYAASIFGHLYAINPDGTMKWRFTADSPILGNPAVGGDGLIYIAPNSGTVYAITPDGAVKWSQAVSPACPYGGNPVLGEDGLLYIGLGDSYLAIGDGW